MKEYTIKYFDKEPSNLTSAETAYIDSYIWGKDYTPRTYARLVFVKDKGFVLEMTAEEKAPRAVYKNYNDPVYTDSCLEFFAAYETGSDRYINMEMNSLGTLLSCVGKGRDNRKPIVELTGGKLFPVSATKTESSWTVKAYIPLDMLEKIYGIDKDVFVPGYAFRGNFYKCGDSTEVPHYGSWSPVLTDKPDFHRPEFFGVMKIEK